VGCLYLLPWAFLFSIYVLSFVGWGVVVVIVVKRRMRMRMRSSGSEGYLRFGG